MTDSIEYRQKIQEILRNSAEPLGPSKIAEKIGKNKSSVHYHLKKLVESGIVISPEEGKYSVNKDFMEITRELGDKILHILSSKEYYPRELQQKLGSDESKIKSTIAMLEYNGLIKEGQISLAERGGIPKKGFTFHVSDYCQNSTYTPTYMGYSKIGFCPICKKKLNAYETVAVSFFKPSYHIHSRPWVSVKIHSKCLPNSKAYETTYGKFESTMFCHHCGLPLSPKTLPKYQITYESIMDHFLSFELESIRLLEQLKQSWAVPFDMPLPSMGAVFSYMPQNSTIEEVYNKLGVKIPDWVLERLKSDNNNPEDDYYNDISHEIFNDFIFKFHKDISELQHAENFIRLLMKYRINYPEDYDVNSRIKDVWFASHAIKQNYENNIRENYKKLLGPEANLYSDIDWAFNVNDYDFDKVRSATMSDNDSIFSQILSVKYGDNYFHPYCAEKLRLNKNHYNDTNSTGGGQD